MTRPILWLLLFSNTLVLLLCAFYAITDQVIEQEAALHTVGPNWFRLGAMLPFCFTLVILLRLLIKTDGPAGKLETLDAPETDQ